MSLSRIAVFIIGIVLAIAGLYIVVGIPFDILHLIVGLVLVIVGVVLLTGHIFTL